MSTKIIVEREIGNRMMRFETGEVAKQASGCVIASYADTVVMCTAMRANPRPGLDFFPLQCDYRRVLQDNQNIKVIWELSFVNKFNNFFDVLDA